MTAILDNFVSILIPCYDAEQWIRQAIESALAQTWPNKEVIVVDDGSTDGSVEIIKSFNSSIRWETGPNRGGNVARNRLLELSSGGWVQYLDADDYLLPEKINGQMDHLLQYPDTDIIFGPVTLDHCTNQDSHFELLPIPPPYDPWILLARWYLPQTGSPLWKKQALIDVSGWKPDQPCCQEHELYLRLLKAGKQFSYCEHGGAIYRQWSESTVCKRDKPEVQRQRLEILQNTESFLKKNDMLTQERHWAINMARFEMARTTWGANSSEAQAIIKCIQNSLPDFSPAGDAAPLHYRIILRLLGFNRTEFIANRLRCRRALPQ